MKCCKEILLPDGKQIPFCAYNSVGYREQARVQLTGRQRARAKAEAQGLDYDPPPLTFSFEHAPSPNGGNGQAPANGASQMRTATKQEDDSTTVNSTL